MKCLSLCQPWASLVACSAKKIETRSWSTAYRGPLAIHASKVFPADYRILCIIEPFGNALAAAGITHYTQLPTGMILATCTLANCMTTQAVLETPLTDREYAFGNYSPHRFAWILDDIKALPEPIPARGSLELWDYDLQAVGV